MLQTKFVKEIKKIVFNNFYFENRDVYKIMWKNISACAMHAGYQKLQTHTHNMQYLLLIRCNNGCKNSPEYYVTLTLPVMLLKLFSRRSVPCTLSHYTRLTAINVLVNSVGCSKITLPGHSTHFSSTSTMFVFLYKFSHVSMVIPSFSVMLTTTNSVTQPHVCALSCLYRT